MSDATSTAHQDGAAANVASKFGIDELVTHNSHFAQFRQVCAKAVRDGAGIHLSLCYLSWRAAAKNAA